MTHWPGLEPHELAIVEDDDVSDLGFVLEPGDLPAGGATTINVDIGATSTLPIPGEVFVEDERPWARVINRATSPGIAAPGMPPESPQIDGEDRFGFGEDAVDARPAPENPAAESPQSPDPVFLEGEAPEPGTKEFAEVEARLRESGCTCELTAGAFGYFRVAAEGCPVHQDPEPPTDLAIYAGEAKADWQIVPGAVAGVTTAEDPFEDERLVAGQVVEDALIEEARRFGAIQDTLLEAVTDDALREEFLSLPEAERDAWLAAKMNDLED